MKLSWRDVLAALLAVFGAVVVFAKLQSYSWWLLGSWKGALGVVAVVGLAILAIYLIDWFRSETLGTMGEMFLWFGAATVVIGSLFATTTKAEFICSASAVGLSWVAQLGAHVWDSTHGHTSHFAHAQ